MIKRINKVLCLSLSLIISASVFADTKTFSRPFTVQNNSQYDVIVQPMGAWVLIDGLSKAQWNNTSPITLSAGASGTSNYTMTTSAPEEINIAEAPLIINVCQAGSNCQPLNSTLLQSCNLLVQTYVSFAVGTQAPAFDGSSTSCMAKGTAPAQPLVNFAYMPFSSERADEIGQGSTGLIIN